MICQNCGTAVSQVSADGCPACGTLFLRYASPVDRPAIVPEEVIEPKARNEEKEPGRSTIGWKFGLAAVLYIALRGRYRFELLLVHLSLTLLLILNNLFYLTFGRLVKLDAQEFGIYGGGWLVRFRIGGLQVLINWLPMIGYVKFRGMDEAPSDAKGERSPSTKPDSARSFTQLRPYQQAAAFLSGPVMMVCVGIVVLGWRDAASLIGSYLHFLYATITFQSPQISEALARFLTSFVKPYGFLRGTAMIALLMGVQNLLPIPMASGGAAIGHLLEYLLPKKLIQRTLLILTIPVLLAMVVPFIYLIRALYRVIFFAHG